jgi:hypothetical protein
MPCRSGPCESKLILLGCGRTARSALRPKRKHLLTAFAPSACCSDSGCETLTGATRKDQDLKGARSRGRPFPLRPVASRLCVGCHCRSGARLRHCFRCRFIWPRQRLQTPAKRPTWRGFLIVLCRLSLRVWCTSPKLLPLPVHYPMGFHHPMDLRQRSLPVLLLLVAGSGETCPGGPRLLPGLFI